jgi:hypothetical protein
MGKWISRSAFGVLMHEVAGVFGVKKGNTVLCRSRGFFGSTF